MDNKIKGDEPAFATQATFDSNGRSCDLGSEGLTIRQQFAAMAMQGFCANNHPEMIRLRESEIAKASVEFADALIAELNK